MQLFQEAHWKAGRPPSLSVGKRRNGLHFMRWSFPILPPFAKKVRRMRENDLRQMWQRMLLGTRTWTIEQSQPKSLIVIVILVIFFHDLFVHLGLDGKPFQSWSWGQWQCLCVVVQDLCWTKRHLEKIRSLVFQGRLKAKKIAIPDFHNIIWYSQMRFLALGHNNSSLFVCFLVGIPKKNKISLQPLRRPQPLLCTKKASTRTITASRNSWRQWHTAAAVCQRWPSFPLCVFMCCLLSV